MHNNHIWILKKQPGKKIFSKINTLHCCYSHLTIPLRVLGGVHSDGAVGFGSVADSGQW